MLRAVLTLGLFIAMTASALADGPTYSYDASKPVNATLGPAHIIAAGVTAQDFTFVSPTGNTVKGEIIRGRSDEPHPGVLFVHWLGDPKTTNHTEFEPDAIALARRGATSVLVDTMWAAPKWFNGIGKSADADYRVTENQVIDLRRALDLLQTQPGVDPNRIAYVGHDFGAMFGALLSGVDTRPSVYVLMAGIPLMTDWYLLSKTIPNRDAYLARIAPFDITGSLAKSKARGYLFQFATHDEYIEPAQAMAFFNAAPLPRGAFFYDTDHALAVPQAAKDRQAWLTSQLFPE
jgi:cephalosporin-C deacetylase-like acetyl esterase